MCRAELLFLSLLFLLNLGGSWAAEQIQCIACGLPKVSPDNDVYGSYGTELGKKRYNHTCEEYDEGEELASPFLRFCPIGVKSCFYVTGRYDGMEIVFRGCAEAMYKHDYGCDREMQPVTVIDQRGNPKQVEVDVNLCYCSTQNCNQEAAGSENLVFSIPLLCLLLLLHSK